MQRRLLEQQMLMERERNQFYQVAQQVMQCIGNTSSNVSALPPNLQLPGFPLPSEHGQTQADNQSQNAGDPYNFLHSMTSLAAPPSSTQNKSSATISSSFPQSFSASSEVNPFTVLTQTSKSTGSNNPPYSMLLAQSSAGMLGQSIAGLGNPLGQQPQWHAGMPSAPTSSITPQQQPQQQQQSKQSQSKQPTATPSVENNPYSMLLGRSSGALEGSLPLAGSVTTQQQSWPPPLQNALQQQIQFPSMPQGWTQEHHFQQHNKSATDSRRGGSASNSSYSLPQQLLGAVGSSGGLQQSGWAPTAQQHGWPAITTSPQQNPQSWSGKNTSLQRQTQQQQEQSTTHPSKPPACTSGESTPYSILLSQSSAAIRGNIPPPAPVAQQQSWSGSAPVSNPSTMSQQNQKQDSSSQQSQVQRDLNCHPGSLQSNTPSSTLPHLAEGSQPTTTTTARSSLQAPFQGLASQLKMTSFQPHPIMLGGVTSSNLTQPTTHSSSSQQQSQSGSLPIRLPSDEEIQNLLDNIQMKCSSTAIPGLNPSDFP